MARIWSSGFELNSLTANVEVTSTGTSGGGAIAISSSTVRSGAYSLRSSNAGASGWAYASYQFKSADSNGPFYARTYLYVVDRPGSLATIFAFTNSADTARRVGIRAATDGSLELWDNAAKIGSSSSVLSLNTWYRVELYAYNNTGTGKMELAARIDGVEFASSTTSTSTGTMARLEIGDYGGNTSYDYYYDDIAINDDTGANQTSYPGSGKIVHLRPNATGDANAWLDTAGSAGTTGNYTLTDEITPDDATTMIQSGTLNNEDLYNCKYSPILLDAVSTSSDAADPTTLTWSHTCSGSDRILVVGTSAESDTGGHTAQTVSGITYAGAPLSKVRSDYITDNGTELWYKVGPATGANDIVITMTAVVDGLYGAGLSFTGVDQTNPIDANDGTTGGGTSITKSLTTASLDAMIVNIMHHQNSAAVKTSDSNQIQQFNAVTTGDFSSAGGIRSATAAGSYTITWNVDINEATSMTLSILSLKPATVNTVASPDTVNVVHVGGRFRNDTADATTAFKFEIEKTSAGTKSQSAAIIPNSTTWKTNATAAPFTYPITLYTDPDASAWTQSTLDTMQIGALLSAANVNKVQVSTVWALVDYTPGTISGATIKDFIRRGFIPVSR